MIFEPSALSPLTPWQINYFEKEERLSLVAVIAEFRVNLMVLGFTGSGSSNEHRRATRNQSPQVRHSDYHAGKDNSVTRLGLINDISSQNHIEGPRRLYKAAFLSQCVRWHTEPAGMSDEFSCT